jgi:hypothetical protein
VFEANGHGAVTLKPWEGEMAVTVTGPHREIFKGTSFKFVYAAPGGNTMMTGPVGLVKASLFKFWKMKSSAEGKDDTEPR